MPMPESEKLRGKKMGFAFVPGTFPTVGVAARMAVAGVDVGWGVTDQLYDAYYLALKEDNLKPFNPKGPSANTAALITSMSGRTSQPKNTVVAWLNALYQEIVENGRNYYLDPVTSDAAAVGQFDPLNHPLLTLEDVAKSIGNAAANVAKPSADMVINIVKYTALGLTAAAIIYGVYQGHQFLKTRKRRKKG